jgi:hypothetical protein
LAIGKTNSKAEKCLKLNSNDFVPDGVLHKLGVGLQVQEFHCGVFVAGNSATGNLQFEGYLFH